MTKKQSDYNSGIWTSQHIAGSTILDTASPIWHPDAYNLFGEDFHKYDLCDTHYLQINQRVAMNVNEVYPQVYCITKVNEIQQKGIFKYIGKRDEWNEKRDNRKLMICDYYKDS